MTDKDPKDEKSTYAAFGATVPGGDSKKEDKGKAKVRPRSTEKTGRRKPKGYVPGGYPSRSIRRFYTDKVNAKKRDKIDIEDGLTPFDKWCDVTAQNIERGQKMQDAYLNEIANLDMDLEGSREARCYKHFEKVFGSQKAYSIMNENRRLQSLQESKEMLREPKRNLRAKERQIKKMTETV